MAGCTKVQWSIEMVKFLIKAYESNELLYNNKHQYYKNKTKRSMAYQNIIDQIFENFDVQCTEEDIKKKINGLRTQYRCEKIKIAKRLKNGAGAESIYTPSVHWYPYMKFLDTHVNDDSTVYYLDEFSSENGSLTESSPEQRPSTLQSSHVSRKRRMTYNSDDTLHHQATRTIHEIATRNEKQDYYDTFGSFIGSELRSMSSISNERFAMKIKMKIQKCLLEAWEEIVRDPIDNQIFATSSPLSMKQE